jgi:predicted HNH restriction endonuclease
MVDKMERITESTLILPALYLIDQQEGISTSELIERLEDIFEPTGEDAAILSGRNDTKFSQIVRNLVSHKTLDRTLRFANYEHRDRNGHFSLTQIGREYLEQNFEALQSILYSSFPYEDRVHGIEQVDDATHNGREIILLDENSIITEGNRRVRVRRIRVTERSKALREAAIQYYTDADGHIQCDACGFDFYDFYGEVGRGYIEIHHETPLLQYEDEDRKLFLREAVERVCPLCSNCHRIVHRDRLFVLDIDTLCQIVQEQNR